MRSLKPPPNLRHMKNVFSFLLCFLIVSTISAQKKYDFEFTIASDAFEKERKIYVHVPERYYENENESFNVIYVLDGQGRVYYNNAKSVIDYLVWSYQISPSIVVGIHSDNRGTEFVPKNRSLDLNDENNTGQAHQLQQHIEDEIFPLVSENFRINDFKALIGHSRGGAFVATTLFSDKKDLFDAYLAISPGMHYLDNQILNDATKMIQEKATFNKFYYCTHGTVGSLEKYFKPQVEMLDSLFKVHPNPTIVWGKKEIEATSHWGCVAPSLVFGMLEMNRAYVADQHLVDVFAENKGKTLAHQIQSYHAQQKKILGFTFPLDAPSLRYYGNQQSEYEQHDRAIELFDMSLEIDPEQINVYLSKAWSQRQLGQNENARTTLLKAKEELGKSSKFSEERVNRWNKNIDQQLSEIE